MIPAQNRQENVVLPEAGAGDPDDIWILRDGAAGAEKFRLSTLPADFDDVAGLRRHMKEFYSVAYASVEADEIVVKDKATSAQLDPAVKLSRLAGNTSTTPYPVKVKDLSSSDVFSLIFKVTNALRKSNLKAIRPRPFAGSFSFGCGSSSASDAKFGLSQEPTEMVPSSLPPSIPSHQRSAPFNKLARKNGSEMDGMVLRRRLVAGSEETDTA